MAGDELRPPAEQVPLPAPQAAEGPDRLNRLTGYFRDIATDGPLDPETVEYVRRGGSLRLALSEILALAETGEHDQAVETARSRYMAAVLRRPVVRGRNEHARICDQYEGAYIDSVVAKVEAVIDAETVDDALALGQMPTLLEQTSFKDGQAVSPEQLAANHLYVLVDTALQEHVRRRELIDDYRNRSLAAKVIGSRALHMTVAGGVFVATMTPKLGLLPAGGNIIGEDTDLALKVLSGTVLGIDAPEAIRMQYLGTKHDRRTRELHEQLASRRELSDQALRISYSSTRYGRSEADDLVVTGRSGTDDKTENLRRFERLDREFTHLNNDPGGKPYTGNQALGYAARLLIERKDQLAGIIDARRPAIEQKQLFLALVREIMVEDLARMKKGLSVSRFRKALMSAVAVVPAMLFPSAVSAASEASHLGRDTVGVLVTESHQNVPEYEPPDIDS